MANTWNMAGAVFLLLAGMVCGYPMEGLVYEVGKENIESWHNEFKENLRVLQIYAPFQMKSKGFSPVYIAVAKALSTYSPKIILGKVDVSHTENKGIMELYKAPELPYVGFFRAGSFEFIPYDGPLEVEALVPFLQQHVYNVTIVTEVEEFEQIAYDENPAQVTFLAVVQSKESEFAKFYLDYAKQNAGAFKFALVEDKGEFAARFDLNSDAVILSKPPALLGKDDLAYRNITKITSLTHLTKQIQRLFPTSINLWTHYSEEILTARKLPVVILYFDLDWKHNLPRVKYMANRLRRATEKFMYYNEEDNKVVSRQFLFAIGDRKEYLKPLEKMQLGHNQACLIIRGKDGEQYVLKETQLMADDTKVKQEAITQFLDAFSSGKVNTYVRSQDVPEEDFDRGVKVVVGETFKKAIMDSKIHVVLLIYSKNYPDSMTPDVQIQETFSKVGETLKEAGNVVIAKIESSLNEIPSFLASPKYPVVYFLPETDKYKKVAFEQSEVTVDGLVKWINENIEKAKVSAEGGEKKEL